MFILRWLMLFVNVLVHAVTKGLNEPWKRGVLPLAYFQLWFMMAFWPWMLLPRHLWVGDVIGLMFVYGLLLRLYRLERKPESWTTA